MVEERESKRIVVGPSTPERRTPSEPVAGRPWAIFRSARSARGRRSKPELISIAEQIVQNVALMERLRAVIGSNNKELGRTVMSEVTQFAREIDPSINESEGVGIVVILAQIIRTQPNNAPEG
jgi:hypothetical protein